MSRPLHGLRRIATADNLVHRLHPVQIRVCFDGSVYVALSRVDVIKKKKYDEPTFQARRNLKVLVSFFFFKHTSYGLIFIKFKKEKKCNFSAFIVGLKCVCWGFFFFFYYMKVTVLRCFCFAVFRTR